MLDVDGSAGYGGIELRDRHAASAKDYERALIAVRNRDGRREFLDVQLQHGARHGRLSCNISAARKAEVGASVYNPVPMRLRLLPLVLLTLSGCGSSETLHVTSLQLGRALNPDNTVSSFTTRFVPGETVYLSVATSGVGSGTLSVRWVYEGHVIDEPKKQVEYRIPASTEFHLQSANGFPPGDYNAEVFLDGQPAGTRPFRVEREH
jgi:hypothetical protein